MDRSRTLRGMPHRRLVGEERVVVSSGMVEDYRAGLSTPQIAAKHGRTVSLTRRLLIEGGAERRSGSPRLTGAARDRLTASMLKDYRAGLTMRQIAEKHRRSLGLTRRLLVEGGVQWRYGGEARRQR